MNNIKYYWAYKKYWWSWTRSFWLKKYYKLFYNISFKDVHGSILPDTRDNSEFMRVQCKGHYIDITDKESGNFIRIIPVTYNHGIMIERWKNGKLHSRNHLSYGKLSNDWMYSTNVEMEGEKRRGNDKLKVLTEILKDI